MDINVLTEKYIALRDKQAEYKAKIAQLEAAKEKVEAFMLQFLQENNTESVKTETGTVYKSVFTSATVADKAAYFDWVFEAPDERRDFLESRVSKTAVTAYMEEHEDTPPGVNVFRKININIRRS